MFFIISLDLEVAGTSTSYNFALGNQKPGIRGFIRLEHIARFNTFGTTAEQIFRLLFQKEYLMRKYFKESKVCFEKAIKKVYSLKVHEILLLYI